MSTSNPTRQDALSTSLAACIGCKILDSNQKTVTCSKCYALWHGSCAGIPDGFDGPWRCNHCSTFCGSVAGSISSTKSTSSARLRLKQLQELKALEDKIQLERAERERRFLLEKHSLEAEAEAEETGCGSIRSSASRLRNRHRDVNTWVEATNIAKQSLQQTEGFEQPPVGVHTSTPVSDAGAIPKTHPVDTRVDDKQQQQVDQSQQNQLNVLNTPLGLPKHMLPPKKPSGILKPTLPAIPSANAQLDAYASQNVGHYTSQPSTHAIPGSVFPSGIGTQCKAMFPSATATDFQSSQPTLPGLLTQQPQSNVIRSSIQLPHPTTTVQSQYRYVPPSSIPRAIPVTTTSMFPSLRPLNQSEYVPWNQQASMQYMPNLVPEHSSQSTGGLISAQQLAARQVVSKELPKFSGDPLEWPMFLSAFESTTAICGIQPDENLARLQRSLVGKAREMVQSILTLPSAIPEIIATLRDECGRPEQLVHCLLSKVRNAPPPNVNKLETIVTFGREVRNLVTYIEAANLQMHLANPMLLSELVAKLPPSMRLDWGLHSQRTQDASIRAFSD